MTRSKTAALGAILATALVLSGCSAEPVPSDVTGAVDSASGGDDFPDACQVVKPDDLAAFFGKPGREPKPTDGHGVVSGCEFRADGLPYLLHVTLSKPDAPVAEEYDFQLQRSSSPTTISGVGAAAHAASDEDETTLHFHSGDVLGNVWTFYDAERTVSAEADVARLTEVARKIVERL